MYSSNFRVGRIEHLSPILVDVYTEGIQNEKKERKNASANTIMLLSEPANHFDT